MPVLNIHARTLNAPSSKVGRLIDGLASADDQLWPWDRWPPMKFDCSLGVGAIGGHGPIGYFVEAYEPGRGIRFRFTRPPGFQGTHRFEMERISDTEIRLRHVIDMQVSGWTRLQWLLVIRPLHDALLEDALARAELFCAMQPAPRRWSLWVRLLRRVLKRGRAPSQRT